jgi:hypothetical protein
MMSGKKPSVKEIIENRTGYPKSLLRKTEETFKSERVKKL